MMIFRLWNTTIRKDKHSSNAVLVVRAESCLSPSVPFSSVQFRSVPFSSVQFSRLEDVCGGNTEDGVVYCTLLLVWTYTILFIVDFPIFDPRFCGQERELTLCVASDMFHKVSGPARYCTYCTVQSIGR